LLIYCYLSISQGGDGRISPHFVLVYAGILSTLKILWFKEHFLSDLHFKFGNFMKIPAGFGYRSLRMVW